MAYKTCKTCIHNRVCKYADESTISCSQFQNKADFVNVVRCRDCKKCEKIIDQFDNDWYFCTETVNKAEVKPNDYCSYGERKGEE